MRERDSRGSVSWFEKGALYTPLQKGALHTP